MKPDHLRAWTLVVAMACVPLVPGCSDDDDDDDTTIVDPGPGPGPDPGPDPDPDPDPDPTPGVPGWTGQGNGDVLYASVSAVDVDHAWTTSIIASGLKATTDGGATWANISSSMTEIEFVDVQDGFSRIPPGLDASSDGGHTWTRVLNAQNVTSFSFVNASVGMAVSTDGILYRTTNGGQSWVQADLGRPLNEVKLATAQTGWIIAGSSILKSVDGGATWSESFTHLGSEVGLTDISTVGAMHVRVLGASAGAAFLLSTDDGGAAWTQQDSPGGSALHFVDASHGWIVGGQIHHTEDAGATWSVQEVPDGFWNTGTAGAHFSGFVDVVFVSPTTGWVVGDNGVILKTTTAGK